MQGAKARQYWLLRNEGKKLNSFHYWWKFMMNETKRTSTTTDLRCSFDWDVEDIQKNYQDDLSLDLEPLPRPLEKCWIPSLDVTVSSTHSRHAFLETDKKKLSRHKTWFPHLRFHIVYFKWISFISSASIARSKWRKNPMFTDDNGKSTLSHNTCRPRR